jgi:nicotinamide-nucleotide amidase
MGAILRPDQRRVPLSQLCDEQEPGGQLIAERVTAEIVGVGTELLLGQIANTNAMWMSHRLADVGVDVLHHQVVGDNLDRIVEALRLAGSRADVVIATGGLGPTGDDLTRDAIAELLAAPMIRHREIERSLREAFGRIGREMPESNLRQADVPEGCRYITPKRGTAPGLAWERGAKRLYAVPGVPAEMREMMEGTILPELAALTGATIVSRTIRCAGIGESRVAELLEDLFEASTNPTVAYLASSGEVHVRLTAKAATADEAERRIASVADEVVARLGDVVFTVHGETLEAAVGRLLRAAGKTLACAESITGGGLARRLSAAPGSSEYFLGSAVVYSPTAKHRILGVREQTIESAGVVSESTAREMAAGARRVFGSDVAVALTGAAGPEPHGGAGPGTVWIALDTDDRRHARLLRSPGEREQVQRWAEQAALDLVRRFLEGRRLPESDRSI